MKYNKLVRDKIPEIVKEKGQIPITHIANEGEYWKKLKEKLREEVDEFLVDSNEEELADIWEVIESICEFKKFDNKKIVDIKNKKKEKRGSFKKRIILDEVRN